MFDFLKELLILKLLKLNRGIVDDVIAVTCNQQLRELSHSAHIFIGMWKRR